MEEIWKTLKYHDVTYLNYEVSTHGNIRLKATKRNRALHVDHKGYVNLSIYCGTDNGKKILKHIKVHIAVASTFIENKQNKPTVNHIDGDKVNNFVENLEWSTYSEQTQHYLDILGYRDIFSNKMAARFSKPVMQLTKDDEFIQRWDSTRKVERELGFSNVCISECARGKRKSAYGYKWAYCD